MLRTLLALLLLSRAAWAADPAALRSALQRHVDAGEVAGALGLVWTAKDGPVTAVVGFADLAAPRPMRTDDLFWIASMTKPVTAVAVLMLQDEGKLSVDDPLARFLPEFKEPPFVQENREGKPARRPVRPLTLRDLLTHTSGLQGEPKPSDHTPTLAELSEHAARQPLLFEPGARWSYGNPGINVLGRVVEVVSGQPYAEFLDARIFKPLGMKDTTFWPDDAQAARIATPYKKGRGGKLEPTGISFIQGGLSDRARPPRPAGGLFSTADDMLVFYRMMLAGGELDGRRYLSPAAHRLLTTTQTAGIETGFTRGMSWGLGFQVVKEPQGVTSMLAPGTYGHGGAYGTQSWADPTAGAVYILMIQRAGFPNGDDAPIRRDFQAAAAQR